MTLIAPQFWPAGRQHAQRAADKVAVPSQIEALELREQD